MKRHYILIAVLSFVIGGVSHWTYVKLTQTRAASIERHWRELKRYDTFVNDAANLEPLGGGFVGFDNPPDPDPHLAALVALNELKHADLVLPTVPATRAINTYWMTFTNQHDDIVYSSGNPTYAAFTPAGEQPLHLQLWNLPSAESKVQQLIVSLESMAKERGEP